jgi:hypothetical protein
MRKYRCFLAPVVLGLSILLGVAAIGLVKCGAAPEPASPDWERQVNEAQKVLGQVSAKLIATAEDAKAPVEDRWRAVLALGRVGDRASLEYLVDHIALRLVPPFRFQIGEEGKDAPCFWALTNLPNGWEGEGRNWNLAQVILMATGKARTEDELWRYAHLLHNTLDIRMSKNAFGESSRALPMVEVELANESQASRYVEDEQVIKERATRVKNLTALKKFLEKEVGQGGKGRDGK